MKIQGRFFIVMMIAFIMSVFSCGETDMWEKVLDVGTAKVIYNSNGGTAGAVPVTVRYDKGITVSVDGNPGNLARLGYTFADWNTAADGSGTTYTEADTFIIGDYDVTLYAVWIINPTYSITYNGNTNTGGSVPVDTTIYQYHQTVTVMGNTGIPALSKTGNNFIGWNTAADGSGTSYNQGQTFLMGLTPVTLYARWTTASVYTVTYNANGGTGTVPVDTTGYINGQIVSVMSNAGNLARSGYFFAGWNTAADGSGTNYFTGNTFSMGGSNVTLYAKWILNTTPSYYTITYNANLADAGTAPVDNVYYVTGTAAPVLPNSGNLVRAGYSFSGWNTKSNGTGVDYDPGSTFTIGSTNVTLYAKWGLPIMVSADFNNNTIDSNMFATNGISVAGGIVTIPATVNTGIKSRLFKIPVIIEGYANIEDTNNAGGFADFCIRQVPDTYSSLNYLFEFGFSSGYDSYVWSDVTYWNSETTTAHDAAASTSFETGYHVFKLVIYNDFQQFYIDDILIRTTYYSMLSNSWWNFRIMGDSGSSAAQQLDWINIYTARQSDLLPVW